MRLAVISDVHASLVPLRAVLADAEAAGVDRIICLGDVIDMGPSPKETLTLLRSKGIACVQGNHDTLHEEGPTPLLQAVMDWTKARLSTEDLAYLSGLPRSLRVDLAGVDVLCVHGSPLCNTHQFLVHTPRETLEQWYEGIAFDVAVCGHTHVQVMRRLDERMLVNVGSVAQPFARAYDGTPPKVMRWAEYVILSSDEGRLSVDMRRVPYDFDAFCEELRTSGFPDLGSWMKQWTWWL